MRTIHSSTAVQSIMTMLTAGFAAAAFASSSLASPPKYSVTYIGPVLGAAALNSHGTVVGTQSSPVQAWVSVGGAPAQLLPLPPGTASSWATDVNDSGIIVGAAGPAFSPEFGGKAVAWIPTGSGSYTVQQLGALPGHVASNATAVNNLGDVVGVSSDGTYRYPVLFNLFGQVQNISSTGVFDPTDINDQRVLVDNSFTCKTLDLNTMAVENLGTPGEGYIATNSAAINYFGQVVGAVVLSTSTSCDRQAARYSPESGWEVLSTCGPSNGAIDINDHGDLVMRANLVSYVRLEGSGAFSIESLIVSDTGHWYVSTLSSLAINNARQLVVSGTNTVLGTTGTLLLTPILQAGDLDGDGTVSGADLGLLLAQWGTCSGCAADLDGNGTVNGADLGALLAQWG
jgi:hypothetical protein